MAKGLESELVEPVAWQRNHPLNGWIEAQPEYIDFYQKQGQEIRALVPAASLSQLQQRIDKLAEELNFAQSGWIREEAARRASDAKLAEAVEVLEPFAEAVHGLSEQFSDDTAVLLTTDTTPVITFAWVKAGNLRLARSFTAALEALKARV